MITPINYVRYVALAVPDFEAEQAFLNVWGLEEQAKDDPIGYYAVQGAADPYSIRLRHGADRRMDLVGFAVESRAGVDALHAHVSDKEAQIVSPPAALASPGGGYGFRMFDCDGRLIEFAADVAARPLAPVPPRSAVPTGISHVVFHTPDVRAAVDWYAAMFGLRVSDWLDDFMCFMRGAGTKHHILAFLKGPAALNHIAFEMENADAVMRGLGRMMHHSVPLNWGPGRHTAGDNVFAYFSTPAGNNFEYTAEVEHLPDDWEPRLFPRTPEIMDQWGTGRITGPASYPPLQPDPGLWQADAA